MSYQFHQFNIDSFLKNFWQKKPTLLKGLFKDFQDPLEADEIAGLAAEEQIESRVVYKKQQNWHVEHGPFEEYQVFGETDWTLLVQAVDHYSEEAAELLKPFRFIPNWRIDDLMVSFSTPGGGVGAHVDQYDVFIIQGMGKRHWRVGLQQTMQKSIPHPDLLQVDGFNACIDEILEPGDVLYIPPGCPHEGYAIEPALNYSVGFRAPNQQDLLSSFADFALQEECFNKRYTDPELQATQSPGLITEAETQKLVGLVKETLSQSDSVEQWLGCYLTQAKHELAIEEIEPAYLPEDLAEMLQQIAIWNRLGGLRCLLLADKFFVNGEFIPTEKQQRPFITFLSNHEVYASSDLNHYLTIEENQQLLLALVNEGFIYPLED
ncbi:cupin domain-containing protein [Catenovulum sediminis]|uniref:Cupin domain-containing protein n=1 Tax=Catenovulum sediminis TaxID=1740262 RepID=A0ABV1REG1_9ALTE